MCGICGVVRFDGLPIDRAALERAAESLRYRGPDDAGSWIGPDGAKAVGLAAVRLAILDPSAAGHQPMERSAGRFHIVHNGEIYNYRTLRQGLIQAGEQFHTDSDTEVLLAACGRWGTDALARLNGMWAFAFYDSATRTGFLCRDRFGVKPLFYSVDAKRLLFASELGGLAELSDFDATIDPQALTQHLRFGYISGPATIYRGVRRLEPGHFLKFTASAGEPPARYYDPMAASRTSGLPQKVCEKPILIPDWVARAARLPVDSESSATGTGSKLPVAPASHPPSPRWSEDSYTDACRLLRQRLADAVVCRRVSDVPIGAFLSGGLDSSIIVAHLSEAIGRPVQTFSVGYVEDRAYDETAYARMASERFGTDHHELILSRREVLDSIPRVLDHLGEPFGDSSIIPTSLVSQFARRHVTVALSGDGGDELAGGYWRYLGHDSLRNYRRIPRIIRRYLLEPCLIRSAAGRSSVLTDRVRQFRKLLRAANGNGQSGGIVAGRDDSLAILSRHLAWSRILSPEAESLFSGTEASAACDEAVLARARALTAAMDGADPLNRVLAFDLQHQLPADMLHKVDLASMMHSLEVRTPFLDPRVVELALSFPSQFKIDRGIRKRILIDAYRGRVPDAILDRPKKGFELPIGEYFRGPLRGMFHDVVTRDRVESFGLLSFDAVGTIYRAHTERRADHADLLFAILSLCWWDRVGRAQNMGRKTENLAG